MRIKELFENTDISQIKNTVRRTVQFHVDEWVRMTGVHKKVLYLIAKVADDQRGAPEIAMMRSKEVIGGGVLGEVLEHVGDLSNRMSPLHSFTFAVDESLEKAQKCLRILESRYGFEREVEENIKANAAMRNIPVSVLEGRMAIALSQYSMAHRGLLKDVVFPLQRTAILAAVALGEEDFNSARKHLRTITQALSSDQSFANEVRKYDKKFDVYMKGEELL